MPEKFVFNDLGSAELDKPALENLQCNILAATGRPKSTHIFRRFEGPAQFARWLAKQAPPTPATQNDNASEVVNLLFTKAGLELLFGAGANELAGMDASFLLGSRHPDTRTKLRDGDTVGWGEHERDWHVVELRAHDKAIELPQEDKYVAEHGSGIDEKGQETTDRHQHSYGHFGILDGIGKLVYTQAEYDGLKEKPERTWKFDPRQHLSTLLVRDPFANSHDAYGSYFVFRKYQQDKDVFAKRIQAIAEHVEARRLVHDERGTLAPDVIFPTLQGKTGPALEAEIKRLTFGRDPDGKSAISPRKNDFDYRDDPEGRLCPLHSHVRKMNPRGRTGNREAERQHLVARRGTSGVKTTVTANGRPTTHANRGLLFWCAQASIENQFEYIMQNWANAAEQDPEENPTPDFDAVVGVADPGEPDRTIWDRWKKTTDLDCSIWKSVTLVAAEYLYAPSLEGFEKIKEQARNLV
jgi:hypothetical protein